MKEWAVLQVSSCMLFFLILLPSPATSTGGGLTMRAELTHVDSRRGFSKSELLSRMAARSRARASANLLQRCGGAGASRQQPATVPLTPGTVANIGPNEYLIHFSIGAPRPQPVALTMDTGSDLVWTQCASCRACFDQPYPLFDPSASKTIAALPCSDPMCSASGLFGCVVKRQRCFYFYAYGDGSITAGGVFRDTFTFKAPGGGKGGGAAVVAPNLSFGCGNYNRGLFTANDSGTAGFGRGAQSLPSQLKIGKFSHCFTSLFDSIKTSPMFLGTPDNLRAHAAGPVQATPLIRNPAFPSFYYLSFKGITVGGKRLRIDESAFAIRKDGSGGAFIDSGTAITSFPQAVYEQLRSALLAQVRLPVVNSSAAGGFDPCFAVADPDEVAAVPKLVFNLEGADMELPLGNFMAFVESEVMCLIISAADDDMTTLGNFQQQNMHIVYDVEGNKLLFVQAQCDKL